MNKYKVTRHREYGGIDTVTLEREVSAESEKQAISQTRYALTKTNKMPNGEQSDYVDDRGDHIYWSAELISKSVVDELDDDPLETLAQLETDRADDIHVIAKGESARRFREIKSELGYSKNTDAFAKIIEAYGKTPEPKQPFIFDDETAKRIKVMSLLSGASDVAIIRTAVAYYIHKMSNMTINDLIKSMEADNGTT